MLITLNKRVKRNHSLLGIRNRFITITEYQIQRNLLITLNKRVKRDHFLLVLRAK